MKKTGPKSVTVQSEQFSKDAFPGGPATQAILDAYAAMIVNGRALAQSAFLLGTLLNEKKEALGHGDFEKWREESMPGADERTLQRYQRAATAIHLALSPPTIDIEASVILLSPTDAELPPEAQKYKKAWFDFTRDKSITQCASGVLLSLQRADNGKRTGGFPVKGKERFAVERFIPNHLDIICSMLTVTRKIKGHTGKIIGWKNLPADQRQAVCVAFAQAIEKLPNYLVLSMKEKCLAELKIAEPERLARHAL
jgi:hypothetical protein